VSTVTPAESSRRIPPRATNDSRPASSWSRNEAIRHPLVGEVTLAYEELAITAEPGHVLLIYTAEPGSPSAERLKLLASWAIEHAASAT